MFTDTDLGNADRYRSARLCVSESAVVQDVADKRTANTLIEQNPVGRLAGVTGRTAEATV